jgi:hypothetical protein
MRLLRVVVALAVLAGCAGSDGDADSGSPVVSSPDRGVTGFPAAGCPVPDPAVCTRVGAAANALTAGDVPALLALSLVEEFDCDALPTELFPDCAPGVVRRGYARSGGQGVIRILDRDAFRAELAALSERVDPGFTDDVGTGELRVLGVGTCGPDDPAGRSYHLAFVAALSGGAGTGPAERWLGSLEFVLRGGEWSFALLYADSMAAWRQVYADPLRSFACGNVLPWGAG